MRFILLISYILIFPLNIFCQGKIDSTVQHIKQLPDTYIDQGEIIYNGLKVKSEKYIKKGDSLMLVLQNTPKKYSKKGDSLIDQVQKIPLKYLKQVDTKIEKYSDRITGKTKKTLEKLSRWETKIKSLLEKVSPETAKKLFSNDQISFSAVLQKIKQGENVFNNTKAKYDEYRDKLTTNLKYIQTQKSKLESKYLKPLEEATKKVTKLEEEVTNTEAIEKFIKERKKLLMDECVKYIGKSKYLNKINKESYYYIETLRNYKEIFSDSKKAEETVKTILNKIPAFKKFFQQNSALASLFGNTPDNGSVASITGLQTRASVNALLENRIASGGPNAREMVSQNMQMAQAELTKLKDKLLKAGAGNSTQEIPDFKPNMQKTKTFLQRLEYGFNYQFAKTNSLLPTTADLGLTVGYKLNDKSIIGIGIAYKMGIGSIEKIKFTHQGLGLRSFIDWKIKKQLYVSGGFEMNYNAGFKNITALKNYNEWQSAGLVGVSKKFIFKTKLAKGTKIQLLYDIFYQKHLPVCKPLVFRIGYNI